MEASYLRESVHEPKRIRFEGRVGYRASGHPPTVYRNGTDLLAGVLQKMLGETVVVVITVLPSEDE